MGRFGLIGALLATAALLGAPAAQAGYGSPSPPPGSGSTSSDRSVDANGNPFSGGLAFDPASVRAKVGDVVSWTNTDSVVPHTSTEDHRLWELSGDYGPPGNMGYGPGETVQRRFAAGTWHYFCAVHPEQMRGVVAVPVKIQGGSQPGAGQIPVNVIWSKTALPTGQVFDVQKRVGKGAWRTVRRGTRSLQGGFGGQRGQVLRFRARVRRASNPTAASGFSPPATVKLG